MYENYLGVNLSNHVRSVYPNDKVMQNIRKECIITVIQIYNDMDVLCRFLDKKYWYDKSVMQAIKKLRKANASHFNEEMKFLFPLKTRSIKWKEAGEPSDKKQKSDRNRTPVGNLRWRERGFKKQKIYAKISN